MLSLDKSRAARAGIKPSLMVGSLERIYFPSKKLQNAGLSSNIYFQMQVNAHHGQRSWNVSTKATCFISHMDSRSLSKMIRASSRHRMWMWLSSRLRGRDEVSA